MSVELADHCMFNLIRTSSPTTREGGHVLNGPFSILRYLFGLSIILMHAICRSKLSCPIKTRPRPSHEVNFYTLCDRWSVRQYNPSVRICNYCICRHRSQEDFILEKNPTVIVPLIRMPLNFRWSSGYLGVRCRKASPALKSLQLPSG